MEELAKKLEESGLQVFYLASKKETELPYIVFQEEEENNFFADGVVYFSTKSCDIVLYTKNKDLEIEDKVKQALSSFAFTKSDNYNEKEEVYEITFTLEV